MEHLFIPILSNVERIDFDTWFDLFILHNFVCLQYKKKRWFRPVFVVSWNNLSILEFCFAAHFLSFAVLNVD